MINLLLTSPPKSAQGSQFIRASNASLQLIEENRTVDRRELSPVENQSKHLSTYLTVIEYFKNMILLPQKTNLVN